MAVIVGEDQRWAIRLRMQEIGLYRQLERGAPDAHRVRRRDLARVRQSRRNAEEERKAQRKHEAEERKAQRKHEAEERKEARARAKAQQAAAETARARAEQHEAEERKVAKAHEVAETARARAQLAAKREGLPMEWRNGSTGAGPDEGYWQQVQRRFRSYSILLRFAGIGQYAAVTKGPQLKKMHDDQCQIMGSNAHRALEMRIWGIMALGGALGVVAWFALQFQGELPELPWFITFPLAVAIGGVAGWFFSGIYASRERWKQVFVKAIILQHADPHEYWHITHIGQVPMPRLSFIGERENYYFGSTDEAGVLTAQCILLKAQPCHSPETKDLRDCTIPDLYSLPPGVGNWSGTSARGQYAIITQVKNAAKAAQLLGTRNPRNLLNRENLILLLFSAGGAAAVVNLMSRGGG